MSRSSCPPCSDALSFVVPQLSRLVLPSRLIIHLDHKPSPLSIDDAPLTPVLDARLRPLVLPAMLVAHTTQDYDENDREADNREEHARANATRAPVLFAWFLSDVHRSGVFYL